MAKPKCTAELIRNAVRLKKGGANHKDIAAAVGVSEFQFSRWINNPKTATQEQLAQEMKKAEADYKNALLAIIAKEAKERDWKAAAWLLERKYPEEYSRRERVMLNSETRRDEAPRFTFDREEAKR